jgi:hypothetical protein
VVVVVLLISFSSVIARSPPGRRDPGPALRH